MIVNKDKSPVKLSFDKSNGYWSGIYIYLKLGL